MTTEQFIGLEEFEEKIDKLDTERDGSHPWLEAEWVTGLIFKLLNNLKLFGSTKKVFESYIHKPTMLQNKLPCLVYP